MKVYAVTLSDRHFDDVLTLHATGEGMDRRVAELKAGYAERGEFSWKWHERSHTWTSYDDGPSIRVEFIEVQP